MHIVHAAVPISKSVPEAQTLRHWLIEGAAVVRASESTLPGCSLEAVVVRVTAPNVINNFLWIDAGVSGIRIVVKPSCRGDFDPHIGDEDQAADALDLRVAREILCGLGRGKRTSRGFFAGCAGLRFASPITRSRASSWSRQSGQRSRRLRRDPDFIRGWFSRADVRETPDRANSSFVPHVTR